jgi:hypothetical protein
MERTDDSSPLPEDEFLKSPGIRCESAKAAIFAERFSLRQAMWLKSKTNFHLYKISEGPQALQKSHRENISRKASVFSPRPKDRFERKKVNA